MTAEDLSAKLIQDTLQAVRSANRLRSSPLLDLVALGRRLSTEGLADTCEGRAALLPTWLEELTWSQLASLRGEASPERSRRPSPSSVDRMLELLAADFRANSIDREVWGALYFRYFSGSRLTMERLAQHVGVADKTLRRRIDRGYHELADRLRREELAARRNHSVPATASAYDRLVFVADAASRSPSSARDELLDVVRGNGHAMLLSHEQANGLVRLPAAEFTTWRVGRIAEWGQPQYRLDERFVALSLLVDCGEATASSRWRVEERHFNDLGEALRAQSEPALVLLGPPGSGKSTLLRRLELDMAVDALRREGRDEPGAITFLVSLNQYKSAPGEALPEPQTWLANRWASRFPKLPPLPALLETGGVVLLLDGLNEMPGLGQADFAARIERWKAFLNEAVTPGSGNRAVIACRSLDYSAPLSTAVQRVPQVRLEPLTDAQVCDFLGRYDPLNAANLWDQLQGTRLLDALRWPYFLRLLVENTAETGAVAQGLAALFTGFIRRALAREVGRDNPRFLPDGLLDARDHEWLAHPRRWSTTCELPDHGRLIRSLSALAYGIQVEGLIGEASQARTGYQRAVALANEASASEKADDAEGGDATLATAVGEEIVRAGVDLGVVEVDQVASEVQFGHQLVQEYFAGRRLAVHPELERVNATWRIADIRPSARELAESLPLSERLPPLPQTGWEETTLLAAVMANKPESFLQSLIPHHLVLAGQAANLPELRPRLAASFLDELRWALVARSRDPEADLRARIDAGLTVGWLGDPRFERRMGPFGEYLMPPLVAVPAAVYPIGDDDSFLKEAHGTVVAEEGHMPRHTVPLRAFEIGRYPVTNAEWQCFVAAGGYDDDRWWDTEDGRRWRQGTLPSEGDKANSRFWRREYASQPGLLDSMEKEGRIRGEVAARWRRWMAMDDTEYEAALDLHLRSLPKHRATNAIWHDSRYNNPSQPVVAINWYEARAYCRWIGAQLGRVARLPTEAEREAAARGPEGRLYPWGNDFDRLKCNLRKTHIWRTTPIGVFPDGETPLGIADMSGNTYDWTSSLIGREVDEDFVTDFPYPYEAADGRENAEAPPEVRRVIKGGGWLNGPKGARTAVRDDELPDVRAEPLGMRVAVSLDVNDRSLSR